MKVTQVTVQKNNKHRVSVFVDNKYAFSLDETDALLMKIKPGRELTQEDIDRCIQECNYTKARDAAFDIISRKPVSSKELAGKLADKGYDTDSVLDVTQELTSLGYINDYEYAKLFLEHCRIKMWGLKKIRYEMHQKGLDRYVIDEVLKDYEEGNLTDEMAQMILSRYADCDLADFKTKQKIIRYFASRGFDFSNIDISIRKAIEENSDE